MNHLGFIKYHNRHIEFSYKGKKITGVVLDIIPYNKKKNGTDYVLIRTENLEKWKTARKLARQALQETIDIRHITSPRFYNQKNESTDTI